MIRPKHFHCRLPTETPIPQTKDPCWESTLNYEELRSFSSYLVNAERGRPQVDDLFPESKTGGSGKRFAHPVL